MNKIHYGSCPICHSTDVTKMLNVKDYSVSSEDFEIWVCAHCQLQFTQDVPDESSITPYYQSSDYISHSNTSKGLINRLYQRVRKFTLDRKAKLIIGQTKKKGSVLDLGAGVGAFLHTMQENGWTIQGIEPDEGARSQAKKLFDLDLDKTDRFYLLKKNSFDAITLWHVLEHVHQLHLYIEQLKSLVKDDGKIFIAVPNYQSLDHSVYENYWAAYDVPRHLYHFTPKAIEVLMKEHGLRIVQKKPMWFDSFYISLLSSKYKYGKTRWIGAGLTGLRSNLKAVFNKDKCSSIIYIIEKGV